jgi:serpin B
LNAGGQGNYELTVANSLWGERTAKFLPAFLDLNKACYGGGLNQVDFIGASEAARQTINKWVEDKTKEKIKDLIPPNCVSHATRLVLVNAVYFKGLWEVPFDKKRTKDEPFHLTAGLEAKVPLMARASAETMPYLQGEGFQAVELAYKGKGVSMLVFLPDQVDGLGELEARCTSENLGKWVKGLAPEKVLVSLPKFSMTWGTRDLGPGGNKALSELGMKDAFDAQVADFSGMNGAKPPSPEALLISAVMHKAFVDVNEEGTEAAAATAVVMRFGAAPRPPKVVRADHPFLFLIRETRTGGILFMGRVADPR